jgi:hypothetical protein
LKTLPFTVEPPAIFRGSRHYVHSTDIYETVIAILEQAGWPMVGPLNLKIRNVIQTRPFYTLRRASDPVAVGASATCIIGDVESDVAVRVDVMPTTAPVTSRRPYDESPAARYADIIGQEATLSGPTGLRPIEAVTALCVHLHKVALPPPPDKRWMLGHLAISRLLAPSEASDLRLIIDRRVGAAMTRTRIVGHDGDIGTMAFILAGG